VPLLTLRTLPRGIDPLPLVLRPVATCFRIGCQWSSNLLPTTFPVRHLTAVARHLTPPGLPHFFALRQIRFVVLHQ
jgi:hypothetical protein